jgi:hypothetical protein
MHTYAKHAAGFAKVRRDVRPSVRQIQHEGIWGIPLTLTLSLKGRGVL